MADDEDTTNGGSGKGGKPSVPPEPAEEHEPLFEEPFIEEFDPGEPNVPEAEPVPEGATTGTARGDPTGSPEDGSQLTIDVKDHLEVDSTGNLTIFGDTYSFVNVSRMKSELEGASQAGRRSAMYLGLATLVGGIAATVFITWLAVETSEEASAVFATLGIVFALLFIFFGALFWKNWSDAAEITNAIDEGD